MTRLTIDPDLIARLSSQSDPVEFCDSTGRTVGHFLPAALYEKLLYASVQIPYTEEEMTRRRQQTGGRSLAEIWKSLGRS